MATDRLGKDPEELPGGRPSAAVQAQTETALTEEQARSRRGRNIAIAVTLFILVALFYVVTVFRMGGDISNRTM